jgi:PII-like signaling protein
MATQPVTVARIYLRESEHLLGKIISFLHDEEKVSGVTVSQGIAGFGSDGTIHTAHLLDLSLDMPLIVEFYGEPARVETVIQHLTQRMHLPHITTWSAISHAPDA